MLTDNYTPRQWIIVKEEETEKNTVVVECNKCGCRIQTTRGQLLSHIPKCPGCRLQTKFNKERAAGKFKQKKENGSFSTEDLNQARRQWTTELETLKKLEPAQQKNKWVNVRKKYLEELLRNNKRRTTTIWRKSDEDY